ncbi:hypothetical protein LIER_25327 [Lithospermum erythrorhizon]|uniref:Uncharacterized protein n=1 Tax=Lithospermum erythrorhizon TaxID=34254 RepID=A0AAV3R8L6_LITER
MKLALKFLIPSRNGNPQETKRKKLNVRKEDRTKGTQAKKRFKKSKVAKATCMKKKRPRESCSPEESVTRTRKRGWAITDQCISIPLGY